MNKYSINNQRDQKKNDHKITTLMIMFVVYLSFAPSKNAKKISFMLFNVRHGIHYVSRAFGFFRKFSKRFCIASDSEGHRFESCRAYDLRKQVKSRLPEFSLESKNRPFRAGCRLFVVDQFALAFAASIAASSTSAVCCSTLSKRCV